MLRVILVAMQDALGSTLSIPIEMLSAASDIAKARRQEFPQLSLRIATGDGMAIKLKGGIRVEPDCKLADCGSAELIFIAGFWGNPQAALTRNPAISQWLRQHSSTPMCALTTGSYFLAQAGATMLTDETPVFAPAPTPPSSPAPELLHGTVAGSLFGAGDGAEQLMLKMFHEAVLQEDDQLLRAIEEQLDDLAALPIFPFSEHDISPPDATCYTAIGDSTSPETAAILKGHSHE